MRSYKSISVFCALGFFILFPGFFFYHTLIGLGVVPAFLGGFFRPMALVFVCVFFSVFLFRRKIFPRTISPEGFLFFCILVWTSLIASWHYFIGSKMGNSEIFLWTISGVLFNLTCFLIGRNLQLDSKAFNFVLLFLLFMMVSCVYFFQDNGNFYLKFSGLGDEEKTATYQGFARSILITGIFSLAFLPSILTRSLVSLITASALYYNGARTEFFCFILSFVGLLLATSIARSFSLKTISLFVFYFALSCFLFSETMRTLLPENRILQVYDLKSSTSVIARTELTSMGWQEIIKDPFFGNYAYYLDFYGTGGYPHNLLAAWVNLGFLGFAMYVALLGLMAKRILKVFNSSYKNINTNLKTAAFVVLFTTTLSLLTAKDYSYMLVGFAAALTDKIWFNLKISSEVA